MILTVRNIISLLVNLTIGIIAFFIGLRVVLRFVAANEATPFVNWIYRVSDNLIAPFSGLIPNPTLGVGAVFDIVAIITLLAYTILGYVIIALVDGAVSAISNRYHTHHEHLA